LHARSISVEVHPGGGRRRSEARPGIRAARTHDTPSSEARARRYAAGGPVGLVSKRFNRPSNNRLDETLADRVIKILRSTYADFGLPNALTPMQVLLHRRDHAALARGCSLCPTENRALRGGLRVRLSTNVPPCRAEKPGIQTPAAIKHNQIQFVFGEIREPCRNLVQIRFRKLWSSVDFASN
jgi:hypothetical protein